MSDLLHWDQPSPIGSLHVEATADGVLCALAMDAACATRTAPQPDVAGALDAYFAGDVHAIDALEVRPAGVTAFQAAVLEALRDVPAGGLTSYGELAREVGRPGAARAVGQAVGANPVAVVLPCHRVVAGDGSLGGYGGGLDRKRWLLKHEGVDDLRGGWEKSRGRLATSRRWPG